MQGNFKGKIYFYCLPQGPLRRAGYQHAIVCLAEGFKELGIDFCSNVNYWKTSAGNDDYLFKHNPGVAPDDCSVVMLDSATVDSDGTLPKDLFHPKRRYITVYMDSSDGRKTHSWRPEFRSFDFIFKTHHNERCRYPSNIHPWAFGLSERIIDATSVTPAFKDRRRSVLVNFRVTLPVRMAAKEKFLPHLQDILPLDNTIDPYDLQTSSQYEHVQYYQTGGRHDPRYYKRLRESIACCCFGGIFIPPWPRDQAARPLFWHRILNKLQGGPMRILQWDSFRFWESLAAGCIAFHLDFEKYAFCMPVMPKNWKHYIGIDMENPQEAAERIADSFKDLERISTEGKAWALENYGPVPAALRLLNTIYNPPALARRT
ncbi:MAG: glycosyltransferase family 1 protein [Candidatus Omnitrophica bacterium]|nr:glycosyltransferase family 1 protein [Candidatus Omnitrophota bacterium]